MESFGESVNGLGGDGTLAFFAQRRERELCRADPVMVRIEKSIRGVG